MVSSKEPLDLSFLRNHWSLPSLLNVGSFTKFLNLVLLLIILRQQSLHTLQSIMTMPFPLSGFRTMISRLFAMFLQVGRCGFVRQYVVLRKMSNFGFEVCGLIIVPEITFHSLVNHFK